MKLIERTAYLDLLQSVEGTPDIKVITGIRRCGKSKLLDAFSSQVETKINTNVIRIRLNLKEYESLLNPDNLYDYVQRHYMVDKTNYLFIDEIQMCKGFERVVNSFYEEEKFDIYITGSNAFLLSSDLATLFAGRVFEISIFPFSFSEFVKYYERDDIFQAFDDYIAHGGMAGAYLYSNVLENERKYIKNVYQSTVIKDVVSKFRVDNENLLNTLALFLMDNIASQTSIRNITNKLISSGVKTNDKTIGAYLMYLCRSFMFYPISRYDIRGKRYLENDKKYYLADLSFRYAMLGTKHSDWGHLYENIVAIELLRRGYEVYVGKLYEREVDFVALKDGCKMYIQVSDDISSHSTLERELSPLLSIKDNYPKLLIARTRHIESDYNGIRVVDIASWLVSQN